MKEMSTSEEQTRKLFKARRTVLQMLRDRGYSVAESDIKMSKQNFDEHFGQNVHLNRDKLSISYEKGDTPTDKVHIFLPASLFKFYLWRVQFSLVNRLFPKPLAVKFRNSLSLLLFYAVQLSV